MYKITFFIVAVALMATWTQSAYAADSSTSAKITLRTDIVETINSIALASSSASVLWTDGKMPVALHRIDFTIEAFDDDVFLPLTATRDKSDAPGIEYVIETREGSVTTRGLGASVLIAHGEEKGGIAHIKPHTTGTFTLLVAFADTPNAEREDRVQVTGLTLAVPGKVAELNASELNGLVSPYTEFYRAQ